MRASKAVTTSAAGKTARKATAPAGKAERASLRFYLSAKLQGRLAEVLANIENAEDASEHHVALSESVVEAMSEGLDYYFMRSLKVAKAGFIVEQSANLGLAGVQRVMAPIIRRVVGRLTHEQVRSIASTIRELMK